MRKSVKKLKCQEIQFLSKTFQDGFSRGVIWAQNYASFQDLENLSCGYMMASIEYQGLLGYMVEGYSTAIPSLVIAKLIFGRTANAYQIEDLWNTVFGEDAEFLQNDLDALEGFCEGALHAIDPRNKKSID